MAVITDGQMEIAGSLIVGTGTPYVLPEDWIQWWTAPQVRNSDVPRSSSSGFVFGRDLLGSQITTIAVSIIAQNEADLGTKIDAWKAACASTTDTTVTLRANLLGRTRLRLGRFRIPGDVHVDQWARQVGGVASVDETCWAYGSSQFEAVDPRTFGDVLNVVQTTRSQPGAGITLPVTLPFTLPGSSGGALSIFNAGNSPAPWTARFDGPLTAPRIGHVQSGSFLDLSANNPLTSGLVLGSGQWVDLVMSSRAVLFMSTADFRTSLTTQSSWFELAPGTNTITFDAAAGSGTFTIGAYDAFYS